MCVNPVPPTFVTVLSLPPSSCPDSSHVSVSCLLSCLPQTSKHLEGGEKVQAGAVAMMAVTVLVRWVEENDHMKTVVLPARLLSVLVMADG